MLATMLSVAFALPMPQPQSCMFVPPSLYPLIFDNLRYPFPSVLLADGIGPGEILSDGGDLEGF